MSVALASVAAQLSVGAQGCHPLRVQPLSQRVLLWLRALGLEEEEAAGVCWHSAQFVLLPL